MRANPRAVSPRGRHGAYADHARHLGRSFARSPTGLAMTPSIHATTILAGAAYLRQMYDRLRVTRLSRGLQRRACTVPEPP